jgi:hypothetical protein
MLFFVPCKALLSKPAATSLWITGKDLAKIKEWFVFREVFKG